MFHLTSKSRRHPAALIRFAVLATVLLAAILGPSESVWAAMGSIRNFSVLHDSDVDIVGAGRTVGADGHKDLGFSLSISGAGAITRVSLRNLTTNRTWDSSTGSGQPVLVVRGGEHDEILNANGSIGLLPFILGTQMNLWVNDRNSILNQSNIFEVTVHFVDNTSATAKITVPADPSVSGSNPSNTPVTIPAATYRGVQNVRITGLQRIGGVTMDPDGENVVTEVRVRGHGTITGFRLRNTSGPSGTWDTMGGNSHLLIVLPTDAPAMLNKPDGSISIPLNGETTFRLVADRNDNLESSQAHTTVYVYMSDNRSAQRTVNRQNGSSGGTGSGSASTGDFTALQFRGRGAYDFVGDSSRPGPNLNRDNYISASLNATGTVTGVRIRAVWNDAGRRQTMTWDTVPTSSNPAIVVTRSDGKPLNRLDGSLSEQINGRDSLLFWFDSDDDIPSDAAFTVTVLFSDGKVVEGGTRSPR